MGVDGRGALMARPSRLSTWPPSRPAAMLMALWWVRTRGEALTDGWARRQPVSSCRSQFCPRC